MLCESIISHLFKTILYIHFFFMIDNSRQSNLSSFYVSESDIDFQKENKNYPMNFHSILFTFPEIKCQQNAVQSLHFLSLFFTRLTKMTWKSSSSNTQTAQSTCLQSYHHTAKLTGRYCVHFRPFYCWFGTSKFQLPRTILLVVEGYRQFLHDA